MPSKVQVVSIRVNKGKRLIIGGSNKNTLLYVGKKSDKASCVLLYLTPKAIAKIIKTLKDISKATKPKRQSKQQFIRKESLKAPLFSTSKIIK